MAGWTERERITAVLGPTNTGKTYLAIERMLGHESGMIGFPLRLLARENYDRIVKLKGPRAVALITGEERIIPPHPNWFVCTVESMPVEKPVAFLAVDEIQLAADAERGHVFTQRLLHARGLQETMFLGSDTIRPLLRQLVPEAEIVTRPRFSTLTYTGPQKVTRLPPRSAVVAFSVSDVFEIAELVRRQRGGTAVVLGALSPRARNAQVAMYQAGEVDYMVATDAIGMGLNMDLDHVAFARLSKFDGRGPRRLTPSEIGQIAGRAGRHMNDGTFGTTAELGPLEPELVEAVENHRFDPLQALWWRNGALDFRNAPLLLRSLEARPPARVLLRVEAADDHQALAALIRQPDVARKATSPAATRLLWEVCQVPDFRKVMSEQHSRLLTQIYRYLSGPGGRLDADWVAGQIKRLDRTEGEIDALVQRIAHVRTWTYIANRPGWLAEEAAWQERTRALEDKLSDALHDRITQRFVDRRSAFLVRHLKEGGSLTAEVRPGENGGGEVWVEGHFVGEMRGFRFTPDPAAGHEQMRMLNSAANRILAEEVRKRARQLAGDADAAFALTEEGRLLWQGEIVARLVRGEAPLAPRVEVHAADFLDGELREGVRRRLDRLVADEIGRALRSLLRAKDLPLEAAGRGLVFQLSETLGALDMAQAGPLVQRLAPAERKALTVAGLRFGVESVFFAPLLKPAAVAMRGLLWSVWGGTPSPGPLPLPGRLSVPLASDAPAGYYEALGYRRLGTRAVRLDRLESWAAALRARARSGSFTLDGTLAALIGVPLGELPALVAAQGYRETKGEAGSQFTAAPKAKRRHRPHKPATPVSADNPFAALGSLRFGA